MESKISKSAPGGENTEQRVACAELGDLRIGDWKGIRFVEHFLILACFSCLLFLYARNPIRDDYTYMSNSEGEKSIDSTAAVLAGFRDNLAVSIITMKNATLEVSPPDQQTFSLELSKAIVLFSLSTNILLMIFLDIASRCAGEPINKPPMILLLSACEIFSLIIMVLSLDIFLRAVNGAVLAIAGSALCLSICFAFDLVWTSVKGNE